MANRIRRRVLEHTLRHGGGYLSQACSSAEILATLYLRALKLGPSVAPLVPLAFTDVPGVNSALCSNGSGYNGPRGAELDRFVFSPVHYALVLYSTLIELGRLDELALEQHFNVDGSTVELIGAEHSPGHEVTAGSLGQAISQAGGIALGRRLNGETGRVFIFMSDGEFEEGQVWEALNALSHYKLDNVIVVIDANGQQCDGAIDSVVGIEPLGARLSSFGCQVREVNGHDVDALDQALSCQHPGAPLVIIARTDPCRGLVLLRERAPKLHYVRLSSETEASAFRTALREFVV